MGFLSPSGTPTSSMPYREDIDGLRAVAVLSVLVFHYGPPGSANFLPGGFTGVDVFFVISGFLITSILSREIENGEFSIFAFYDRRIRRIAPALMAVLTATLVAGYFLLMPGDYREVGTSASFAAFGISNFYFLSHTGYFDRAADLLPLIHIWSLGVEEQFYVVWPILLYFVARSRSHRSVAVILSGIIVAGFVLSLIWFHLNPKSAFFVSLPRAWELAIGALLVFLPPLSSRMGGVATTTGLALIVAGFFLVAPDHFPGAAALLPCVGSALVIWPKSHNTCIDRTLGLLSPIGKISYSLYLWHWPIWVFFRTYINNEMPTITETAALVLVSIAVSVLSYRFIEQPFRKPWGNVHVSIGAGLAVSVLVLLGGAYVNKSVGMPSRIPEAAQPFRSLNAMWEWPCEISKPVPGLPPACVFGAKWENAANRAILWGDSHAEHLAPLVESIAKDTNTAVMLYLSCPAILDATKVFRINIAAERIYNETCKTSREQMVRILSERPDINLVILASSWSALSRNLSAGAQDTVPHGTTRTDLLENGLKAALESIRGPSRRIFVVANVPSMTADPIPCIVGSTLARRACDPESHTLSRAGLDQLDGPPKQAIAKAAGSHAIFPSDAMCKDERCIATLNGQFLYRDPSHIRRNLPEETKKSLAKLLTLDRMFQPDVQENAPRLKQDGG